MREIKFRGKLLHDVLIRDNESGDEILDMDAGEWVYGTVIMYTNGESEIWEDHFFDTKTETISQYTGLKDKNGKEIYEGDIVKDKKGFGLIKWLPCNCAFGVLELTTFNKNKPIKEQEYYKLNCGEPRQLKETEVIGNIYDNPELWEEVDDSH